MKLLYDGFAKDDFYSPDLSVTKYTYVVRSVDEENYKSAWAELSIAAFDGKRKYWLESGNSSESLEDGSCKLGLWAGNGRKVILYIIGEPVTELPKWKFYENATDEAKEISGTMLLKSNAKLSFKRLALAGYDEKSNVSETDWYNAVLYSFTKHNKENDGGIHRDKYESRDILRSLMRWYEYEIELNPHERITNTIEAPMYPDIDKGYEPGVYDYTYLLSPASSWAKFGKLNIDINTPFYMFKDGGKGFTKTETGYNFKSDRLPKGELEFLLSESEKPKNERNAYTLNMILRLLLMVLPYIAGGVVIVIIIIILVKRFGKSVVR